MFFPASETDTENGKRGATVTGRRWPAPCVSKETVLGHRAWLVIQHGPRQWPAPLR